MRLAAPLLLALAVSACDAPRPRFEAEPEDGGGLDDAPPGRLDGAAEPDGERDARAATPDGAPTPDDAALGDAAPEGSADGWATDAGRGDAAADPGRGDAAAPGDAGPRDGSSADLGAPAFFSGVAHAADQRVRVTVRAGDFETVTDEEGHFELDLPRDAYTFRFSAEGHQEVSFHVVVQGPGQALEEPVFLYRGTWFESPLYTRLLWRFDDSWLLMTRNSGLFAWPLPDLERGGQLAGRDHEVVVAFATDEAAVLSRFRTVEGLAGDLYRVPLDGDEPTRVFVEAQPWTRHVGGRYLGMVHTREALSRLESAVPGEAPTVLAEGVPWLLVTNLNDEGVAWVAGDEDRFDVYVGDVAGGERISPPDGPASDLLLMPTPGAEGLLWLTPDRALWRWERGGAAHLVATDVLENPRPRFLGDGRLLLWRAGEGGHALAVHDGVGETPLVAAADGFSFALAGAGYYVRRPGRGLWYGLLDGEGADVVAGDEVAFTSAAGGAVALVDGVAWRVAGDVPERLGGEGLRSLQSAPFGATAWDPEEGGLYYLPAPEVGGALRRLVAGAPSAGRVWERGGAALYVLGPEQIWSRVPLPAAAPVVPFDRPFADLTPLDAGAVLGRAEDGALWQVDPQTGFSFGWARAVADITVSPRRGWAVYAADRGLFLVPLAP